MAEVKKPISPVVASIVIVLVVLVVIALMWKFTQPVKVRSAHPEAGQKAGGISINVEKARGKVPIPGEAGGVAGEQPAEAPATGGQ